MPNGHPRQQRTETVAKLYNGLKLERRNGSPNLYARVFLQGKRLGRSTGESTLKAATKVATDWYLGLMERIRKGEYLHGRTFSDIAEKFIQHAERVKEVSPGQIRNYQQKWSLLKKHFDGVKLTDIDTQWLSRFRDVRARDRTRTGALVKPTTLKKDLVFIRLVLNHAKEWEKTLETIPQFPSFRGTKWAVVSQGRPFLASDDYRRLIKTAWKRMREPGLNPRSRLQRKELYWMIHIMVGAALRVGEAQSLRWRDCGIGVLPDDTRQNILRMKVLGKHSRGGKREDAYGNPMALSAFYCLSIARGDEEKEKPDALIFKERHRDGFRELLIAAGLRDNEDGLTRDLKSLRPTGISLRLDESSNPNYRDVAKWARTSPKMIADFYDQTHPDQHATRVLGRFKKNAR